MEGSQGKLAEASSWLLCQGVTSVCGDFCVQYSEAQG